MLSLIGVTVLCYAKYPLKVIRNYID